MANVFISYIRENHDLVNKLAHDLKDSGVKVWLDRDEIKPGIRWELAIRQAISGGDFFIACFSEEYSSRSKSYMNKELAIAIDELMERSIDSTWFIPVKLTKCEIPNRSIGGGETLRSLQWVDLSKDWSDGINRILSVIRPHDELVVINIHDVDLFTHQLVGHLVGIRGYLHNIEEGIYSTEKMKSVFRNMHALSGLTIQNIKSFRTFIKLLQSEIKLYKSSVDLGKEIKRIVDVFSPIAQSQLGQKIILRGMAKLPKPMVLDSNLISQLLSIFLDNAIKYSFRKDEHPDSNNVFIRADKSRFNIAVIEFINFGFLIDPEDVPNIFNRGFRTEIATKREHHGTGMGLFIAKKIIDAHHGEIRYECDRKSNMNLFELILPSKNNG